MRHLLSSIRLLVKPVVFVGSCLFALVAAELALRFWISEPLEVVLLRATDFHQIYFEEDPSVGVVRRADVDFRFRFQERPAGFVHVQTNNLGLRRATPTEVKKPTGGTRILLLGDSQLDGIVDTNENLTYILEGSLRAQGKNVEVLNAATGSYSPYQSYLWYLKFGRELEPDLVIFSVYLGNDLAELLTPGRPRLVPTNGSYLEEKPTREFLERMSVVEAPSTLRRLHSSLIQRSTLYARLSWLLGSAEPAASGPMAEAYARCLGCTAQSFGQIGWFLEHGDGEDAVMILGEILRRLKEDVRARGANLLLLLVPTRLQVEPEMDRDRIQEVCKLMGVQTGDLTMEDRFSGRLWEIGQEHGVEVVDLKPEFIKVLEALYYDTDWHLNVLGHRIAAEILLRKLDQDLLLK